MDDKAPSGTVLWAEAPAKINLTLSVLGRRDDGYHDLRSLVIGVGLSDRVACRSQPGSGCSIRCDDTALAGLDNLAYRSAVRFAEEFGLRPDVEVDVRKAIPVGGGMGGGSSDAATTLRLCNKLWGIGAEAKKLASIGASLGSDVPLFFYLPCAVMSGRGECVEPVSLCWSGWVLLVVTDLAVSTREVYAAWRNQDRREDTDGREDALLSAKSAGAMSELLGNGLEPSVLRVAPEVARLHDRLDAAGDGPWPISGAGSTFYRLFDDKEEATQVATRVEGYGLDIMTRVVAAPAAQGEVLCEE